MCVCGLWGVRDASFKLFNSRFSFTTLMHYAMLRWLMLEKDFSVVRSRAERLRRPFEVT